MYQQGYTTHFTESVQDKDRQPSAVPSEKCWKPVYINNKSPWAQDEYEIAIPETFKTDTKCIIIIHFKKNQHVLSYSKFFIINSFGKHKNTPAWIHRILNFSSDALQLLKRTETAITKQQILNLLDDISCLYLSNHTKCHQQNCIFIM